MVSMIELDYNQFCEKKDIYFFENRTRSALDFLPEGHHVQCAFIQALL